MAGLIAYIYPAISFYLSRQGRKSSGEIPAGASRLGMRSPDYQSLMMRSVISAAVTLVVLIFLYGFYRFERQVEGEAARVREGQNVNGLSFIVPFIDVRATRAWVTWLGDEDKRPVALGSPYLMYFGPQSTRSGFPGVWSHDSYRPCE
jgi:hypothetical protein